MGFSTLFSQPTPALDNHSFSLDGLNMASPPHTGTGYIGKLAAAIPFATHFQGRLPCVICTEISVHKYLFNK